MSSTAAPQTNGVSSSSPGASNSQGASNAQPQTASNPPAQNAAAQPATTNGVGSTSQPAQSQPQPQASAVQTNGSGPQPAGPNASATSAPKPRDHRTIELLLNAQGVTAFESRVPLLLLDFAYRHTASVLSDSLYLSADPYTSHAGAKPSAASGATASVPATGGDANVSANAVRLAISSRLAYSFHGGGGATGGGGISKDALANLAAEKNKISLPRVPQHEWGIRLPNERFVMTGVGWGLQEVLARGEDDSEDEEEDEAMLDAIDMQPRDEDMDGEDVEGGTMEDAFGMSNTNQVGEEDVDMVGGTD